MRRPTRFYYNVLARTTCSSLTCADVTDDNLENGLTGDWLIDGSWPYRAADSTTPRATSITATQKLHRADANLPRWIDAPLRANASTPINNRSATYCAEWLKALFTYFYAEYSGNRLEMSSFGIFDAIMFVWLGAKYII